jgi:hypothetical protein
MKKTEKKPRFQTHILDDYRPFTVVVIVVILFTGIWYLTLKLQKKITQPSEIIPTVIVQQKQEEFELPPGWKRTEESGFEFRAVKNTDEQIKPVVNLVITTTTESNKDAYVNDIIKGARSSFPSLTITKDTKNKIETMYIRQLTGYYYNGTNKISLQINIYIKGNTVYTLTAAAYNPNTTVNEEINQIISSVYNSVISRQ